MPLLLAALAVLGLWLWLRGRGRRVSAQWVAIAGALIGATLAAKGMPVVGALIATGSGLWLQFGPQARGGGRMPPGPPAGLDRAEAADLLGVAPDADRETILAAYRRLMARNHPDAGGSAGLAARLNAARDALLKSQAPARPDSGESA